jgi:lipid-binding SYLF domain-containing protein
MLPLSQSYLEWQAGGKGEVRPDKAAFSGSQLGKQKNGAGSGPVFQYLSDKGLMAGISAAARSNPRVIHQF